MKKRYLLDTNILMQTPNAILGFADNDVIITGITLQELDYHKSDGGEAGYNTREAIRLIYDLKDSGDYRKGILLPSGGRFFIETNGIHEDNLPKGYDLKNNDNKIISAAVSLSEQPGAELILVTNDISMSINATVAGVKVQNYKNTQAKSEDLYYGYEQVETSEEIISSLYANNRCFLTAKELGLSHEFVENEYLILKNGQRSVIARYSNGCLYRVDMNKLNPCGVKGKNACSNMALDALMRPAEELPLVFLIGPAGCGKTFLSLASGLNATENGEYFRVMISRNNILSDADIGFLPGDLEEKMSPLIAPFTDNLRELLRGKQQECNQADLDELFDEGTVEICSMAYMRGRSLTNTYLIIDEAQNATPGQIMEVITRAGEGTKIVICGDPDQIDNPKLDRRNNGLVVAAERMRGSSLCTQIMFSSKDTVRSALAKEAAERLKM